jgi:hypothetical protein
MVYDPDEIYQQIEMLRRTIHELLFLPVLNAEDEVVSYADLDI